MSVSISLRFRWGQIVEVRWLWPFVWSAHFRRTFVGKFGILHKSENLVCDICGTSRKSSHLNSNRRPTRQWQRNAITPHYYKRQRLGTRTRELLERRYSRKCKQLCKERHERLPGCRRCVDRQAQARLSMRSEYLSWIVLVVLIALFGMFLWVDTVLTCSLRGLYLALTVSL